MQDSGMGSFRHQKQGGGQGKNIIPPQAKVIVGGVHNGNSLAKGGGMSGGHKLQGGNIVK